VARALIERYWEAQDPYDPAALGRLRHRAWTAEWPQSRERIPSHDADVAIHTAYERYPAHRLDRLGGTDEIWRSLPTAPFVYTPIRISGASNVWIAEARLDYPDDGEWLAVVVVELAEGLICLETVYYCRAFGPAPWPMTLPLAMPSPSPALVATMEHDVDLEARHLAAHADYLVCERTDPNRAVGILFHEDAVFDRPQYGQRASGRAAISLIHEEQARRPPGRIRRVIASGDVLVVESRLGPMTDSWLLVRILEFRGNHVARVAEYLAEPYEPPDSRKPFIEHLADPE
jgi:hypothetical protein